MPMTALAPIVPNAPVVQGGGKKLRFWTHDEDQVLLRVVGDTTWKDAKTINWRQVCKVLSWRTPQQCRGRFRRLCIAKFEIEEVAEGDRSRPLNNCTRCGAIRMGHACPYLKEKQTVAVAAQVETPQTAVVRRKKAVKEEEEEEDEAAFPALDDYVVWKDPSPADIVADADWAFGVVLQ